MIVGTVASAHAATGYDRCLRGKVCLFDGAGGTFAETGYYSLSDYGDTLA